MGLVQDKICLVTGGASNPGLGHAIAHKFAAEGARVIVTDMDKAGAARTAKEITAARRKGRIVASRCDRRG